MVPHRPAVQQPADQREPAGCRARPAQRDPSARQRPRSGGCHPSPRRATATAVAAALSRRFPRRPGRAVTGGHRNPVRLEPSDRERAAGPSGPAGNGGYGCGPNPMGWPPCVPTCPPLTPWGCSRYSTSTPATPAAPTRSAAWTPAAPTPSSTWCWADRFLQPSHQRSRRHLQIALVTAFRLRRPPARPGAGVNAGGVAAAVVWTCASPSPTPPYSVPTTNPGSSPATDPSPPR
jgi:hypothetical protein